MCQQGRTWAHAHTWPLLTCLPYSLLAPQRALVQAFKKKNIQHALVAVNLTSTVSPVCWLMTSVTLWKESGHCNCHSAKCNIADRMSGKFRGPHTGNRKTQRHAAGTDELTAAAFCPWLTAQSSDSGCVPVNVYLLLYCSRVCGRSSPKADEAYLFLPWCFFFPYKKDHNNEDVDKTN